MSLTELVRAETFDADAIAKHLDGLTHQQRLEETRALPRALFPTLFEGVRGNLALAPEDLVPKDHPHFELVRHHGVNSLPMFRLFEKPMYRTPDGDAGGRNVQVWQWATGPGYFTVTTGRDPEEVLLNYNELPSAKPEDWPKIVSNARGLSNFVFRALMDYVRRVSEHVTIGEAWRDGKNQGQYFILVRE